MLLQTRDHGVLRFPLGAETAMQFSQNGSRSQVRSGAREADPDLIMLSGFHTATEPSLRPPARSPSAKESPSTAPGRDQERRLKRSGEGARRRGAGGPGSRTGSRGGRSRCWRSWRSSSRRRRSWCPRRGTARPAPVPSAPPAARS